MRLPQSVEQEIEIMRKFMRRRKPTLLEVFLACLTAVLFSRDRGYTPGGDHIPGTVRRENNQTFVYVSHDEEEVMAISDRVAVIIDGKIAQLGTPDDVYSRPNSISVAEVIGSPPMNFFDGQFSDDSMFIDIKSLGGRLPVDGKFKQGSKVTLGIRPEDIWLTQDGDKYDFELSSISQ